MATILAVGLAGVVAWKTGAFGLRQHLRATPASWTAWRKPIASAAVQQRAVDRFVGLGYPVMCGGGTKKLVALTFDDGPGPYTQKVLHELRNGGARATFFLVGRELADWPNLQHLPRHELKAGALGDHTWTHRSLPGLSPDDLDYEIGKTQKAIARTSGAPVRLFRPPYGATDATVDSTVRSLGMLEVLWSVDSGDSGVATATQVESNVLTGLRPGAIVLFHENRGTTLHAMPSLLRAITARGYRMVSVPELLAVDPPSEEQLQAGACP
jgi:peptidoglycan/xylan/chitin deacetylase (PgdA/CDA1 family)